MKRGTSVAIAIGGIVLLCGMSPTTLPQEVSSHIREMSEECSQVGGIPKSEKAVESGYLDASHEFWAVDEGAFQCSGAETLFSGTAGSQILVYVSVRAGHAEQVFIGGAYGMNIEHEGDYASIWLRVGGTLCGQKGNPTHAEMISCTRALKWDASTQRLAFAPLSEARFPDRTPPVPIQAVKPSNTLFSPANGRTCKDYSNAGLGYWVCPGPGGYAVAFIDEGNIAGLAIGPARSIRKMGPTAEWLGASKVFGDKVQWIVREGVPKAAVIRIWRRKEVDDPTEMQELAVYAIDRMRACAHGSINIHLPKANDLALARAEEAADVGCPDK